MKLPFFGQVTYKFSDKKISSFAIMSVVLGLISAIALIIMTVNSYKLNGEVPFAYGFTSCLSFVFALIGCAIGFYSRSDKDSYVFAGDIGIGINVIVLLYLLYVLGLGIMNL